jgi:hypothetical protein
MRVFAAVQAGYIDIDALAVLMERSMIAPPPEASTASKARIHELALGIETNDPTKVMRLCLFGIQRVLHRPVCLHAQPDYSAYLEAAGRNSANVIAQQQKSAASASFHLTCDSRIDARASQERAALHFQRVFRGWRQRMYNRVNALKYDVLNRRERAVAKAWVKARRTVADKVCVCSRPPSRVRNCVISCR